MPDRGRRHEDWGEPEGNKFLRALFARSWFLVIPLLGVWWYDAKKVDTQVAAIEEQMAQDRKMVETSRTKALTEARRIGISISRLRAIGDTLAVRNEQVLSLLDSVRVIQEGHLSETRGLEAQADSLRAVLSRSEGTSMEASARLQQLQGQVDSLRNLITLQRQESDSLATEIQAARDLADRILNPDLYRKNNALVTGEGEFPNRDALPKRE